MSSPQQAWFSTMTTSRRTIGWLPMLLAMVIWCGWSSSSCHAFLLLRRSRPTSTTAAVEGTARMILPISTSTKGYQPQPQAWKWLLPSISPPATERSSVVVATTLYSSVGAEETSSSSSSDDNDTDRFDPNVSYRLPENHETLGTTLIRQAGAKCGATGDDALDIQWKAGKIIVIVHCDRVYVSGGGKGSEKSQEEEEEELELDDEEYDDDEMESEEEGGTVEGEEEEEDDNDDANDETLTDGGIDVSQLAREINIALDENGLMGGWAIAQTFEIEVTTPGASDELVGMQMFQAYKGFDVICAFVDLKQKDKKKGGIKEISGKLVERSDQYTKINIKGRMKSIRNDQIVSVKLPKAKKEKGAR